MSDLEPERLALQLQELMQRRAKLKGILEQALRNVLTDEEREDIHKVLGFIDEEMAGIERRLQALRSAGSGGSG